MQKTCTIVHRLCMVLRLVDATTGKNISGKYARVYADDKPQAFLEKLEGMLLFREIEPERFTLRICADGYDPVQRTVDLKELDEHMPLLEVALIPSDQHRGGLPLVVLNGTLKGIEDLYAARHRADNCWVRLFDKRSKVLNVFNPNRLMLDGLLYAVVDEKEPCAQPFRIVKCLDDEHLQLDRDLTMTLQSYCSVSPVVSGRCEADGSYCLKLRQDDLNANWIVGWTVDGQTRFRLCPLKDIPLLCLE